MANNQPPDRGPVYGGWECGKFGAGEHGENQCGIAGCQAVVTLLAYTALRGELEESNNNYEIVLDKYVELKATHDKLRVGVERILDRDLESGVLSKTTRDYLAALLRDGEQGGE